MSTYSAFAIEPWAVREPRLDLDNLAVTESVLALANGHLGVRANLDEGEPFDVPGSYLGGFWEVRPLPYGESAYGYPEDGQTIVNVTNGKIIRLLVEDEPLDIRYGELLSHERVLDFRAGVMRRTCEWRSPAHTLIRISSTRLVSFVQRAVLAIEYQVESLESRVPVVLQSELVTNEWLPEAGDDPRAAATPAAALASLGHASAGSRALLMHTTKGSGLLIGAAMDHVLDAPPGTETSVESFDDVARFVISTHLEPGQPLRLVKFVTYAWSSRRTLPAVRDQVSASLIEAKHTGWEGLVSAQRAHLDDFWDRADIEIQGDPQLQQAVRFGLFQALQAGARAERSAIGAKGLTGPGYDGHTFWDTESFVLRMLTYTAPRAVRDSLLWRHRTLDLARARAQQLGFRGASFPWRTIHGEECSGYWPAGTAAFHINASIADAVARYYAATGDDEFDREIGLELLVETARLWRSIGHHDALGAFRIDGVTGPDEYSALVDNNVYTNLMAQRNLREAAHAAERNPKDAARLEVDDEEVATWRDAADAIRIPYDDMLGVHPQADGFTRHERWNFAETARDEYPLMLHFHYFDIYRKQVVKQADLVHALYACGDAFTAEEKTRDFAYYEPLTVRDSSLSACTQAVVAAEVGHLRLAYDYMRECALMDLRDLEHNTRHGLHIAALAGTWIGAVAGFGGMRDHGGKLSFAPRLPRELTRLVFRLTFRGRRLKVDVTPEQATYSLAAGDPLQITHHGNAVTVHAGRLATAAIPPAPALETPPQPPGREPGGEIRPDEPATARAHQYELQAADAAR